MPRMVRMIDVFLSSPSDVEDERQFVVEAAREWNSVRGANEGVFLNILTWEDAVAPSLSDRPQDVINEQIGDEYDVYLGVMWSKLGSPTGKAESGTVEEFERALDRYREGDAIRLAMLFKTADIPQALLKDAQFDEVLEFKGRFAGEGGLFRDFEDDERLRKILSRLFEDIAGSHSDPDDGPPAPRRPRPPAPTRPARAKGAKSERRQKTPTLVDDRLAEAQPDLAEEKDDFGIFDINDQLTSVSAKQVDFFQALTEKQNVMNVVIEGSADEMNSSISFGKADSKQIRASVSRVSKALSDFGDFLEECMPSFKARNDELIDLTERGLDVSRDFGSENEGAFQLRNVISEVAGTMDQNRANVDQLIGTLTQLPRLSGEFNRARRSAVQQYRQFGDEIDRLQSAMKTAVSNYPMPSPDG